MNSTPELFAALRSEIESAPLPELPSIRGQLAALEAELLVRLTTPQPVAPTPAAQADDRLLTVDEAAARMRQKPQWIRAHQDELHCIRFGRTVRFSERQLAQAIQRRSHA